MNKINLFVATLLMAVGLTTASAATIDIPTPNNEALDLSAAYISGTKGALKSVDGIITFDSFMNGDSAVFDLNNTVAQKYTLSFRASVKQYNAGVEMIIIDKATEKEEVRRTVMVHNNGTWGSVQKDFIEYSFITDEISTGDKQFIVIHKGPRYTLNTCDYKFIPYDPAAPGYKLNVTVNPEEAGTIEYTPGKEEFQEGDSVILYSTANNGYEFAYWSDAAGNAISTNANDTIVISGNTDLTANFNVYEPANTIPTTDETPWDMSIVYIQSSESRAKWDGDHIDYMTAGSTATYRVLNTVRQAYQINFEAVTIHETASVKFTFIDPSGRTIYNRTQALHNVDGSWSGWDTYSVTTPVLEEGVKYTLVITFQNTKGTTGNLRNISMTPATPTSIEVNETSDYEPTDAYGMIYASIDLDPEVYNSIALPFTMSISAAESEWGKLAAYQLTNVQGDSLIFESTDIILANEPMLIYAYEDFAGTKQMDGYAIEGATPGKTLGKYKYVVNLMANAAIPDSVYYIKDDAFKLMSAGEETLKTFRAYINRTKAPIDSVTGLRILPEQMKIVIDGEMITAGIQAVTTSKAAGNGNVYNLSGQLVGKAESVADLPKGIYITRGKKVIIK